MWFPKMPHAVSEFKFVYLPKTLTYSIILSLTGLFLNALHGIERSLGILVILFLFRCCPRAGLPIRSATRG